MPLPPNPAQFLKHYLLIRWNCVVHGQFETGTLIWQHTTSCPECGSPADYVEHCEGQTTKSLPFVTRPRSEQEIERGMWQVNGAKGVTTRPKSQKASIRRGGRRSTGRPKKNQAPPAPRTVVTFTEEDY